MYSNVSEGRECINVHGVGNSAVGRELEPMLVIGQGQYWSPPFHISSFGLRRPK
jgi:hypothetical protein